MIKNCKFKIMPNIFFRSLGTMANKQSLKVNTSMLNKNMMSLCKQKYLKLPRRKFLHVRESNDMKQREIIYMKRNDQIKAVCEKYKESSIFQDTYKFKPYADPFLLDVKNNLLWCRIAKVGY